MKHPYFIEEFIEKLKYIYIPKYFFNLNFIASLTGNSSYKDHENVFHITGVPYKRILH